MTDDLGQPPTRLLSALTCGDRDAALDAIRAGDDVNARDARPIIGDGTTALHLAASDGDCVVIRELIRHGADVNVQAGFGQTPLLLACEGGHFDAIMVLLVTGSDTTITNRDGYAPRDRIRASETRTIAMYDEYLAEQKR